jgi:probable F420-dependent oxidoreductase
VTPPAAPLVPVPSLSIQLVTFAAHDPGGWGVVLELARVADRAGVDRLVVSDHVVFGERLDEYGNPSSGGVAGGKQPTGPDGHWLEPLTFLSVVAGTTDRIRLGTAVLQAALRRPAVLAKQAATLDVLSGGRLDLGVGIGWQREEYEACGLDFTRRGSLLDHTLEVCRTLWTERVADIDDGVLRFERIHAMPKPLRDGGVPVWVSGRINERTLARIARFGVGWIPWGDHVADPGPGIEQIRRAFEQAGRDPGDLQVQGVLPIVRTGEAIDLDATMAGVAPLLGVGVTDFRFRWPLGADPGADAEVLGATVEAFREAVGRPPV